MLMWVYFALGNLHAEALHGAYPTSLQALHSNNN